LANAFILRGNVLLDIGHFRRHAMLTYLWIAAGGALGKVARYWCNGFVSRHFGETFPWGTMLINVGGSFVIGFFATFTGTEGRWLVPATFRQFFMIGLCGGYTTFSSFSLQTLDLVRDGDWLKAGGNIIGSVILCLVGVWLGHLLAATLNSFKGN
jgi:fluoride exporter